jgi:hypothetical protein
MSRKVLASILSIFFLASLVLPAEAAVSYPRLANYFLKWDISNQEIEKLAKWDLLVLDMEIQENNPQAIRKIRQLNPDIIILAYIASQETVVNPAAYQEAAMHDKFFSGIDDDWWLRDQSGGTISNWPGSRMLNISSGSGFDTYQRRFQDYLAEFVAHEIKPSGLWDGVFYDSIWSSISWLNGGNIDLDNDGQKDQAATADTLWVAGVKNLINKTKSLSGNDFIVIGNGNFFPDYQSKLNGLMFEDFPKLFLGRSWSDTMSAYLKADSLSISPALNIINTFNRQQNDYRSMRYGLTSALLGNGFFSRDYDVSDHGQLWWYDEYSANLGLPEGQAYNLLSSSKNWQAGLWRRDFQNGLVIINSSDKKQVKAFPKETFQKLSGSQDPKVNSGELVNYIQLEPNDGIVFLRRKTVIKNATFVNGYFYRFFDSHGRQNGNGFFSYSSQFPGEAEAVLAANSPNDEADIALAAFNGYLTLYKEGKAVLSFPAYGPNYRRPLSLSAPVNNRGYFSEIAIGSSAGGGPQVRVFNLSGKILGSFFAYDKNNRGGVNVALGDVDGDGNLEVVTGPGAGLAPAVKIFTINGQLKKEFLAYDKSFLGGVNVCVSDLNNDGSAEILTGPAKSGGPQVRIFSSSGRLLGSFFAFDSRLRTGIKIGASDQNGDGFPEIAVGIKEF